MHRLLHPDDPITVIAHSHGGNVTIEATNLGATIDNLVTIGTPLRADHTPNINNIINWFNLYSESDMIQHIGENEFQAGLQPAARRHPSARNIEVHWNNGPRQTHSDLRGEVGARTLHRAMQRIRP